MRESDWSSDVCSSDLLVATQVWNKPIEEAVTIANTVAGLSCRALDGQSGIPTKAELAAFLAGARS